MQLKVMRVNGTGRKFLASPLSLALFLSSFVLLPLLSLVLPAVLAGSSVSSGPPAGASPVDTCFCQVDAGTLDDCPCTAQTVDKFNRDQIHDKLMEVVRSDYFRYFQVNFNKPCSFWPDAEGSCSSRNCNVETCPEQQVPLTAKQEESVRLKETLQTPEQGTVEGFLLVLRGYLEPVFPYLEWAWQSLSRLLSFSTPPRSCQDSGPLPEHQKVDTLISDENIKMLNEFCTLDPLEASESCDFIDLLKNEEKFTGYSGRASNRIWEKIYQDLCFQPEDSNLTSESVRGMCPEKRAFFRIVSGLHTSITVHLCKNYLLQEENVLLGKPAVWGPNIAVFRERFDPARTANEGPQWLKNAYFLYLVELRAVAKAAPLLKSLNIGGDAAARSALNYVLETAGAFPNNFEEDKLFNPEDKGSQELLAEFKANFRQISAMMDCMGCERCKVWGKLQVTGIGTALKILFTPPESLTLTRHETVALLNAFARISTSIRELEMFRLQ